jgi:hypothetical protein
LCAPCQPKRRAAADHHEWHDANQDQSTATAARQQSSSKQRADDLDYSDDGRAGSDFGRQTVHAVLNLPVNADSALRVSVNGDRLDGVERNNFDHENYESNDYGVRARYLWSGTGGAKVNLIADFDKRTQN